MTYTKEYHEPLNFMECIQLLELCVGHNYILCDDTNPNNIIVYLSKTEEYETGYYSRNLLEVASELVDDIEGQEFWRDWFIQKNIPLEFFDISGNKNQFLSTSLQ